jgi:hypothetical protein
MGSIFWTFSPSDSQNIRKSLRSDDRITVIDLDIYFMLVVV